MNQVRGQSPEALMAPNSLLSTRYALVRTHRLLTLFAALFPLYVKTNILKGWP